jgi:hypothetical protein
MLILITSKNNLLEKLGELCGACIGRVHRQRVVEHERVHKIIADLSLLPHGTLSCRRLRLNGIKQQ